MKEQDQQDRRGRITIRAMLLGVVFTGLFAVFTVRSESPWWRLYAITQIPVLPYMLLLVTILALNPLLRLIRIIKPFTAAELLIVFVMGMVPAGIPAMGLCSHLIPVVGGLFNEAGNTEQSRWDLYIEPYVNEGFFIAEPGTRAAAIRLRDADAQWRDARRVYNAANSLQKSRAELADVEADIAAISADPNTEAHEERLRLLERRKALAINAVDQSRQWWAEHGQGHDLQDVLRGYPAKIAKLEEVVEARKAELDEIEAPAFEKVATFRRGLKSKDEDLRAVAGVIPGYSGESAEAYLARWRRLLHGTAALDELRKARERLDQAITTDARVDDEATGLIRQAVKELEPISDPADLLARKADLEARAEAKREELFQQEQELRRLRHQRYFADADTAERVDEQIADAEGIKADLTTEVDALNQELTGQVIPQITLVEKVITTRDGLNELADKLPGADPEQYPVLMNRLQDLMKEFRSFDASIERFVFGDIDWRIWIRPLTNWALLIFTLYIVFMTFNVLIFKQWAHNENIVYPLAQLPLGLAGAEGDTAEPPGRIPAIFRSGLFWAGLCVSAGILGWNEFLFGKVPGIGQIPLRFWWNDYIKGSIFDGLQPYNRFDIFFILIGLTFLIPSRISASLWSFQLLYLVQLLVLVWLGYGQNEGSFVSDEFMTLDFRSAQGGGALMVFAAVIFWKCRKYIFCGLMPKAVADMEVSERRELKISSWTFLAASVVFILLLHFLLGASMFYSVLYYLILMVVTIGLVRTVAEAGFLSFKVYFGPFHFIRSVFGMNKTWSAPSLMTPLFIFHAVMFYSYRTFIAPAMANALKIRDELRLKRKWFHVAVMLGILIAFLVGSVTHIMLSYNRSADGMAYPTYRHVPHQVFSNVKTMAMTNPVDTVGGQWWMVVGAGAMVALLYFRRHVFWLPHPIGLIMLINPMMRSYWFSIFLGWVCKSLVSKYGDKVVYRKFRYFFIGLIVGDLLIKGYSGQPLDTPWLWEN